MITVENNAGSPHLLYYVLLYQVLTKLLLDYQYECRRYRICEDNF